MAKSGCAQCGKRALPVLGNAGRLAHRPVFEEFLLLTRRNFQEARFADIRDQFGEACGIA